MFFIGDKEVEYLKEIREKYHWHTLKQEFDDKEIWGFIFDQLDTREAVIAIGEEEKNSAEASKGKCGDSVFRAGYMAGIDFMLDSIHNPKEAIPTPQPNLKADNPSSRKPWEDTIDNTDR